jgi:hypothetical protein
MVWTGEEVSGSSEAAGGLYGIHGKMNSNSKQIRTQTRIRHHEYSLSAGTQHRTAHGNLDGICEREREASRQVTQTVYPRVCLCVPVPVPVPVLCLCMQCVITIAKVSSTWLPCVGVGPPRQRVGGVRPCWLCQ